MILTAMADLHGDTLFVPQSDLVLIAGDIQADTRDIETHLWYDATFRRFLNRCGCPVVATPGNHDWMLYRANYLRPNDLPWQLLVDRVVEVSGVRIAGIPWSLPFMNWAFMADEARLSDILASVLEDAQVDILLVHGPPYGRGDLTSHGRHVGSLAVSAAIREYRIPLVVTGHIHEARGWYPDDIGTVLNCAIDQVTFTYDPVTRQVGPPPPEYGLCRYGRAHHNGVVCLDCAREARRTLEKETP